MNYKGKKYAETKYGVSITMGIKKQNTSGRESESYINVNLELVVENPEHL